MPVYKLVKSSGCLCASHREQKVFRLCTTLCLCPAPQGAVHTPGAMHAGTTFLGKPFPKNSCRDTSLQPKKCGHSYEGLQVARAGCLPLLPGPRANTRKASLGLSGSSRRRRAWMLVYPWVLGCEVGNSRSVWMKEDKKALWDLLQVKEECKPCSLPDKRQQLQNYQRTEGTLRKSWDTEQRSCGKHRARVVGGTTMPAGDIKSALTLTRAGVQQLTAKNCSCLYSWSWRAKPRGEMLQWISGPGKGSSWLMGKDGYLLQGATGLWGGLTEGPSFPSRGQKCPRGSLLWEM